MLAVARRWYAFTKKKSLRFALRFFDDLGSMPTASRSSYDGSEAQHRKRLARIGAGPSAFAVGALRGNKKKLRSAFAAHHRWRPEAERVAERCVR